MFDVLSIRGWRWSSKCAFVLSPTSGFTKISLFDGKDRLVVDNWHEKISTTNEAGQRTNTNCKRDAVDARARARAVCGCGSHCLAPGPRARLNEVIRAKPCSSSSANFDRRDADLSRAVYRMKHLHCTDSPLGSMELIVRK